MFIELFKNKKKFFLISFNNTAYLCLDLKINIDFIFMLEIVLH